jgi:DNA-binding CsgD family transcriptional regulator
LSLNALLLLLVIPIALVGWRWGPWAASVGAVVAMGLVGARSWSDEGQLGALGYLDRATAFGTVAFLAGALHRSGRPEEVPPAEPLFDGVLSDRELEVLARMAEGDTNAQIADSLVIAESTVKSHVKSILRKLDAANRTQAVSRYSRSTYGQLAMSAVPNVENATTAQTS